MNAASRGDGAFAQTLIQIPARRLQCRGESENHTAQKREQHGKNYHAKVRLRIERKRDGRSWQKRNQNVAKPEGKNNPPDAADGGEQKTSGKKLANNSTATGTECKTNGHLALPGRSTCQQQI